MAKKIREFMTHRDPDEHIWVERDESAVIGTARMGQRLVPKIRPFDLLRNSPRSGNRTQVMIWEGDTLRIAAENLVGTEEQLTRASDHDLIFFQFCGRSTIESECGVVELEPGEFVLVPAAISHRSSGKDECLRVRVATRELVNLGVDPEKPLVETKFKVRPSEPFTPKQRPARRSGWPRPRTHHFLGSAIRRLDRARSHRVDRHRHGWFSSLQEDQR